MVIKATRHVPNKARAYLVLSIWQATGARGAPQGWRVRMGIFTEQSPTGWRAPIVLATAGEFRTTYDDSDDFSACKKALEEFASRVYPDLADLLY